MLPSWLTAGVRNRDAICSSRHASHEPEDLPKALPIFPSRAGESARMKKRVQSSGPMRLWGFFILEASGKPVITSSRRRTIKKSELVALCYWLWVMSCLLMTGVALADDPEATSMKRRQQGILTGMPFMANVAARTFVDDLGRKIYLAKAPSRIISLAPSITEMLFAIGAQDLVVGVTQFCDYPPEALQKPKVGYAHPNIESIVALEPDLVVAPRESLRADLLAKLEQLKIPTLILEAKTVEDIPSHIQTLGRLIDRAPAANAVAMDLRRRLAQMKSRAESLPKVRVLYVLNSQPLITVGPGSFIHQLIGLAGGANIATDSGEPYPRLNLEAVLQKDPEVLIFPVGKAEGIPESEQRVWTRWTTLTAVRRGRLHRIPADLLNRPGPRIVQGLELLLTIIHPEAVESASATRP